MIFHFTGAVICANVPTVRLKRHFILFCFQVLNVLSREQLVCCFYLNIFDSGKNIFLTFRRNSGYYRWEILMPWAI